MTTFKISEDKIRKQLEAVMGADWLLIIERSFWGNRKMVPKDLLEEKFKTDADKISAVERLVDKEAIARVVRPMNRAKTEIRKRYGLPWMYDRTFHIRGADFDAVEAICIEAETLVKERVEELIIAWPDLVAKDKTEHPDMHNSSNYPEPLSFRQRFSMGHVWTKMVKPIGEGVKGVSPEIIKRENAKFEARFAAVAEQGIVAMRNEFLGVVTHMRDVLKDGKVFQESVIEKPKMLLDKFRKFNVYGDVPFENMLSDLESIFDGVYAQDLRDDNDYRKEMAVVVNEVAETFKNLPTVEIERFVDF